MGSNYLEFFRVSSLLVLGMANLAELFICIISEKRHLYLVMRVMLVVVCNVSSLYSGDTWLYENHIKLVYLSVCYPASSLVLCMIL